QGGGDGLRAGRYVHTVERPGRRDRQGSRDVLLLDTCKRPGWGRGEGRRDWLGGGGVDGAGRGGSEGRGDGESGGLSEPVDGLAEDGDAGCRVILARRPQPATEHRARWGEGAACYRLAQVDGGH